MFRLKDNQSIPLDQVMILLVHKLRLEDQLKKLNDTISLMAPEVVQLAYLKLAEDGKVLIEEDS